MGQMTLFEPPANFSARLDELKESLGRAKSELLLQVELSFALMELLGLDDEPVTVIWAILSGMPLRHSRLQNLDEMERRAIANTRQIVPFSGRFAWLRALRSYINDISPDWRNYDFATQNLDCQIINATKRLRHQTHQNLYESCLIANLEFRVRNLKQVEVGTTYQFEAKTEKETITVQVKFTRRQVNSSQSLPLPWFAPRPRAPFLLDIGDLESDATYLDEREQLLARRYRWAQTARGRWVNRFRKINFRKVTLHSYPRSHESGIPRQGRWLMCLPMPGCFLHMIRSGWCLAILSSCVQICSHNTKLQVANPCRKQVCQ